jgi:hypothetical protein
MVPASERREWLLKCSLDRATVDAYEAGLLNLIHTTSIAASSSGSSTNKRSIHIGGSSNRQRARQAAAAKSALQAAVWRGIPPQMRRQLYFYFSGAEGLLRAATAAEASPANPSKSDPKSASATTITPVDPTIDPTFDPPPSLSQSSPTSPRGADGGRAATQTKQAAAAAAAASQDTGGALSGVADPIHARAPDAADAAEEEEEDDDDDDDDNNEDEDDGTAAATASSTHPPRKKRELEHEYYCRKLASLGRICSPDVEQIRRDVCRTAGRHMTVVSTAEGQAALQVGLNE